MKVYKLIEDKSNWEIDKTYQSPGKGELHERENWFRCYDSPILAVFHSSLYESGFKKPRLFEADTMDGIINRSGQLLIGTSKIKLIKEVDLPRVTAIQKIAYMVLCMLEWYPMEGITSDWIPEWFENTSTHKDHVNEYVKFQYISNVIDVYNASSQKINLISIAEKAMKY